METLRTVSDVCQDPNIKPGVRRQETAVLLLNPKCAIFPVFPLEPYHQLTGADRWPLTSQSPLTTCAQTTSLGFSFLHSKKDKDRKIPIFSCQGHNMSLSELAEFGSISSFLLRKQ